MNSDQLILQMRSERFRFHDNIKKQFERHGKKECNCVKKKKTCTFQGTLDMTRLTESAYLTSVMPMVETLYNVLQSVTQSLRSKTGKDFEEIISEVLDRNEIPHANQVYVNRDDMMFSYKKRRLSHKVDIVIPVPKEGDYAGDFTVVSCKTKLRERHLQDKFLKVPYTLISLENVHEPDPQTNVIQIRPDGNAFENWINDLKIKSYKGKKTMELPLRVLDLFCGCGGFSMGLNEAGLDVMLGIDVWDKAIESYSINLKHDGLCKDLTTFTPEECSTHFQHSVDVIVGGPPCQSFSIAGKRDKNDPRGSLFMEYVKYLDYFQPKAFLFENVMGILSMKTNSGENVIDIIMGLLSKNYTCILSAMYASDYEVPQNRKRVIIMGIRKDLGIQPSFPPVVSKERIPVSKVLLPREEAGKELFLSKRALDGIQKKRERMRLENKGFGAQFLNLDKPSFTIPARYWKDGYDALVKYSDDEVRRLSVVEIKRIQTFPDTYQLSGSKKDQIMQLGNAVACRFAYHLGKHLQSLLSQS